jgi:hypothetical protein
MKVEFVAAEKLSDRQEEALEQLGAAVYPPEVEGKLPGSSFTWASPQRTRICQPGDARGSEVV